MSFIIAILFNVGHMETVLLLRVSSDRLEGPRTELRTPGYKTSGLSIIYHGGSPAVVIAIMYVDSRDFCRITPQLIVHLLCMVV